MRFFPTAKNAARVAGWGAAVMGSSYMSAQYHEKMRQEIIARGQVPRVGVTGTTWYYYGVTPKADETAVAQPAASAPRR